jgi:predicted transcriptional regulator
MATLAAFPKMLEHDRQRHGLRVCRAAWLLGVSVRKYRELESGSFPTSKVYERIGEVFGWPQTVHGPRSI